MSRHYKVKHRHAEDFAKVLAWYAKIGRDAPALVAAAQTHMEELCPTYERCLNHAGQLPIRCSMCGFHYYQEYENATGEEV